MPLATVCGAILLIWPALLNRYPILFSDTGGFLQMGLEPSIGWDKPWIYGPLLALFSLHGLTLWLPLAAQGLLTSYVLWLTQAALHPPQPAQHIALCLLLAVGSAAPWVAATMMPDLFSAVAVLSLFLLALTPTRLTSAQTLAACIIAAIGIASHLSNLVTAAACIATAGVLTRRLPWRPAAALAGALVMLLASNAVGNGRLAISPNGAVFALARLVGDGPARAYLHQACPQAGYYLCAWKGRLTADSDQFLWDPNGPFWANDIPLQTFAAEAAAIVRATVFAFPIEVLHAATANTARQLVTFQLGDTLGPDHLDAAVLPRIKLYFHPSEAGRYAAGLQVRRLLQDAAKPLQPLHIALLIAAAAGTAWLLVTRWRSPIGLLAAVILAALAANAFATGALSAVHDRYQARIAWLLLLPPALLLLPACEAGLRRRWRSL